MQAIFVDLPNFYCQFLRSGLEEPQSIKHYFLNWFDFDRLATALTGDQPPSVWVFYSGRRIGPSSHRIDNEYLNTFINYTNSLRGVTAWDANIPGQQREPISYTCTNCGHPETAQWESEKGIDASLTVHLFDTMESWDVALLLSGDADFVPAVSSLRRRGKIVIGTGFTHAASPALIRECYDYVDLSQFLREDIAAYQIFKEDGIFQNWLLNPVKSSDPSRIHDPITLNAGWILDSGYRHGPSNRHYRVSDEVQRIFLSSRGPIDLASRREQIMSFKQKFPDTVENNQTSQEDFTLVVDPDLWEGVERRLESLQTKLKHLNRYEPRRGGTGYEIEYHHDNDSNEYKISHGLEK